MIYHVIATPECNLCCTYCCEKAFCEPEGTNEQAVNSFEAVPLAPQYSLKSLDSFLAKDRDKPVSIIFYGGEPLLNIDFIKDVMDLEKKLGTVKNFLIQTNGTLLNRLPAKYINRFHTILVSIDGGRAVTDRNRGEGSWGKVTNNLRLIKERGFGGELISRMAVEEPTDFFSDVMELIRPTDPDAFAFTSIHWQLDANMWHDYDKRNFSKWSKEYNAGVTRLADFWVSEMKQGNFLRLYPFLGVMNSLLFNEKYYLRCGSGIGNFTILPNGKISACPIMSGMKDNYLGDINTTDPNNLPFKLTVNEPCTSCSDYELCGGRCLYSNLYPVWPKNGIDEVCTTIKHLIKEMKRIAPELKNLLAEDKIKKKDFEFLKYNCAEIIP